MLNQILCVTTIFLARVAFATNPAPPLEFDHVWIVVSPSAPERAALEKIGFRAAPTVNRHEGQGTASITFEFQNAFLELLWPDESVPVAPGREPGAEKFRKRMQWRTSGWCPIGIGLRRTAESKDPLPLPAWSIALPWLPPGSALEILTPRDDTRSPSLFIAPASLVVDEKEKVKAIQQGSPDAPMYNHPIGVRRITAIRLISPKSYQPIQALDYLRDQHILETASGDNWLLELTFDGWKQGKLKDLRPDLPLLIRY